MDYTGNSNLTIMDFVNNINGSLDNTITTMALYGITKLDQDLSNTTFDVNYNTINNIVNTLTINSKQLSTGDRAQYDILTVSGSFSDGYSDGFDSTTGQVITAQLQYYYGSLSFSDIDEAHIINLTIIHSDRQNNLDLNFNPILQRFVYAYPLSYGNLSVIRDQNGFNVTDSFLTQIVVIAGVTFIVYYNDSDTTQINFKNSFYI